MNVAWIIGNGFDLNLGLNTGYKAFVHNCYLNDLLLPEKRKLVDRINSHQGAWGDDIWSNLELLSGRITSDYCVDEMQDYYRAFQGMSEELRGYLLKEQDRFNKDILPKVSNKRFFTSIFHLNELLSPRDGRFIGNWASAKDNFNHEFISLNYTNTLDAIISKCNEDQSLKRTRSFPGIGAYTYKFGQLVHIHGTLDSEGGIVFCVNDARQIANLDYANDPDFVEAFTKEKRNELFGTYRTNVAFSILDSAAVIVIYGCSLGETDSYIWEHAVNAIVKKPESKLLMFAYDMPRKGNHNLWDYQQKRRQYKNILLSYANMDKENEAAVSERIEVLSSDYLFDVFSQEE